MLAKFQLLLLFVWPFILCAILAGLARLLDCPQWAVITMLVVGVVLNVLWGWFMATNIHVQ